MRWIVLGFSLLTSSVMAETPADFLAQYQQQARQTAPGFAGFSAERGQAIFTRKMQQDGKTVSCTTCHTANPRQSGETPQFRTLGPLAPSANPKRFTDAAKVEKWFKRNCKDVYARECTALEKGDVLTWLVALK